MLFRKSYPYTIKALICLAVAVVVSGEIFTMITMGWGIELLFYAMVKFIFLLIVLSLKFDWNALIQDYPIKIHGENNILNSNSQEIFMLQILRFDKVRHIVKRISKFPYRVERNTKNESDVLLDERAANNLYRALKQFQQEKSETTWDQVVVCAGLVGGLGCLVAIFVFCPPLAAAALHIKLACEFGFLGVAILGLGVSVANVYVRFYRIYGRVFRVVVKDPLAFNACLKELKKEIKRLGKSLDNPYKNQKILCLLTEINEYVTFEDITESYKELEKLAHESSAKIEQQEHKIREQENVIDAQEIKIEKQNNVIEAQEIKIDAQEIKIEKQEIQIDDQEERISKLENMFHRFTHMNPGLSQNVATFYQPASDVGDGSLSMEGRVTPSFS